MDGFINPNLAQLLTLGTLGTLLNQQHHLLNQHQINSSPGQDDSLTVNMDDQRRRSSSGSLHSPSTDDGVDHNVEYTTTEKGRRVALLNRVLVSYPRDATEYELKLAFKPFGTIVDCLIPRDRHSKLDKGEL
jgi:hypothetical protein